MKDSKINPKYILYHGTGTEFDKINILHSIYTKDFGDGFYLTDDFETAKKRAIQKGRKQGYGIVYGYYVPKDLLDGLRVHNFQGVSLNWFDFVVSNRNIDGFKHDYDVVIGPTADANAVGILDDYMDGEYGNPNDRMVKAKVIDMLKTYVYGKQFCFSTQNAVNRIQTARVSVDRVSIWG